MPGHAAVPESPMTVASEYAFIIGLLLLAGAVGAAGGVWVYGPAEASIPWFKGFGFACAGLGAVALVVGLVLRVAGS